VLAELNAVRSDCGTAPLAAPIGGILAGQAVTHVLTARRWAEVSDEMRALLSGAYGNPPLPFAPEAAAHATEMPTVPDVDMADLRSQAGGAGSEEDLLLLALFGDAAARLLDALRGRGGESSSSETIDSSQSERIRELVRLVEGSDVGELTVEDGPLRITVRKQEERPAPVVVAPSPGTAGAVGEAPEPEVSSAIRLESPMVGTFYSSPSPAQPAFVDEGDRVEVGQTLCILEAMKLFNEFKSDHAGVIRRILVENAQPVEYGQPLFELEPV
jgi:oxaloacetate decarboxylase (Na+ extruding) subunit alpha